MIKINRAEAGVKNLLCKHEEVSLDRQHPCKNLGIVACACSHSAEQVKTGGALELTGHLSEL